MTPTLNSLGQVIGFAVPNWTPPPLPPRTVMQGRYCRLEPLNVDRHATALHDANLLDGEVCSRTCLHYGPFGIFDSYRAWLTKLSDRHLCRHDPLRTETRIYRYYLLYIFNFN